MVRNRYIKTRLTEEEFKKVKQYADRKDVSVSEVIRDYIKSLPEVDAQYK